MSFQQRGHLETAPPYTVPCEECEVLNVLKRDYISYVSDSDKWYFHLLLTGPFGGKSKRKFVQVDRNIGQTNQKRN